jgi:3-hydroxyanthranilate 3,4-dioxygenase
MELTMPFNLREWIDDNRELLKPPVCNKQVFVGQQFIVQVVGGPNSRDDYHYDLGPELFYQLEGEMLLKTMQDGEAVDIRIGAGEIFLLPPEIPHSPQRFEDSVGLVVERQRAPHEEDGFMWFCTSCNHKLYEEFLHVSNIVDDLPPVFERFYSSEQARTCDRCGTVMPAR